MGGGEFCSAESSRSSKWCEARKERGFPALWEAANLAKRVVLISSDDADLVGVCAGSVGTGFSMDNEMPKTHNREQ